MKNSTIILYITVACFYLTNCGNANKTVDKSGLSAQSSKIKNNFTSIDATVLSIDNGLLKKYQEELKTDSIPSERQFIKELLNIVDKFSGKALDTTIILIGNIDGEGNLDSIFSRVWLRTDTVFVDSWWIQGKDTLWNYKLKNPYFAYASNLMQYDSRSIWVTFAIGVLYGAPSFYSFDKFTNEANDIPKEMILNMGISDLKEKDINLSTDSYEKYLKNFKGSLFLFEDPESREGLYIWYKPAKCFITYYHP